MMDMGMSMGTNVFQAANMALARDFWYIIAVVLGIFVVIRAVNFYQAQMRFVRGALFLPVRDNRY
jgi:uncharacterized membrane protein YhaH (DUF805 family)